MQLRRALRYLRIVTLRPTHSPSGGLLLETYARGGMVAAEKLIREQFAAYMYLGGKGRVINRAEYLRWKFRDQEQVLSVWRFGAHIGTRV